MTETTSILECKFQSLTQAGQFRGLASDWDTEADSQGDIIRKGAFRNALKQHATQGTKPAFLWSHKMDTPLGHWLSVTETERGLEVVGQFNLDVAKAREIHSLMKSGSIGLSIGFMLAKGGARMKGDAREITDISRLPEISAVAVPANHRARIHEIKQSPRAFEKTLIEMIGLSNREAKRVTAKGWRGLVRDEQEITMQDVCQRVDRLLSVIENERGL